MKNIYKVNEEAVKKIAERVYDNGSTVINRNDLEEMFPELKKESEDERIRNGIIQYLEQSQFGEEHYQIDDDIVRNYIAWLEKQGEQNLIVVPKFRVGDVVRHIPNEVNMSQVEYRITRIDDKFYYSELEDGVEFILFGFPVEDTWELVEQKTAKVRTTGYWNVQDIEQKPAWSEEDDYCIHQLIVFCENCMIPDSGAIRCAHWLKSLKGRYTWKPSESEMKWLHDAIESTQNEPRKQALISLYSDLMKLREG